MCAACACTGSRSAKQLHSCPRRMLHIFARVRVVHEVAYAMHQDAWFALHAPAGDALTLVVSYEPGSVRAGTATKTEWRSPQTRAAQGLELSKALDLTLSPSTRRYRNQDGVAVYSDTALFQRNTAACPNKLKPINTPVAPAKAGLLGNAGNLLHPSLPPAVVNHLNNFENNLTSAVDVVVNHVNALNAVAPSPAL